MSSADSGFGLFLLGCAIVALTATVTFLAAMPDDQGWTKQLGVLVAMGYVTAIYCGANTDSWRELWFQRHLLGHGRLQRIRRRKAPGRTPGRDDHHR